MKPSRRTQLIVLAASTLILAIVFAARWVGSPLSVQRAGEAIVLMAGAACAIRHCRRIPSASPAVLLTTLIGGLVVIARPGGRLYPLVVSAFLAITWVCVVLVQKFRISDVGPGMDLAPSATQDHLS